MLCDKHIAHLKMLAFLQIEDTNEFKNHITQESVIYKPQYQEWQPYKTDYNRRMHDICITLNKLLLS